MRLKLEHFPGRSVRLRIACAGGRAYFATGVVVAASQWSEASGGRVVRHPLAKHLNAELAAVVERAVSAHARLSASGVPRAADVRAALASRQGGGGGAGATTDICDYIAAEVEHRGVAPNTKLKAAARVEHLRAWPARPALEALDYAGVVAFERWLLARPNRRGRTLSPATVRTYMSTLRGYVAEARRAGLVVHSPFQDYRPPKRRSAAMTFLTAEEVDAWFGVECDSRREREVRDYFALICVTGLRRGDALRLTGEHFAYDAGGGLRLRLTPEKRHRDPNPARLDLPLEGLFGGRAVGIVAPRLRALAAASDRIFGRLPSERAAYETMDRLAHRAGITRCKVTPHVGRHTFATQCLNAGLRLEHVSAMMGHRSTEMTSVYARVLAESLDPAVREAWAARERRGEVE